LRVRHAPRQLPPPRAIAATLVHRRPEPEPEPEHATQLLSLALVDLTRRRAAGTTHVPLTNTRAAQPP
jgi:hypothetical protein